MRVYNLAIFISWQDIHSFSHGIYSPRVTIWGIIYQGIRSGGLQSRAIDFAAWQVIHSPTGPTVWGLLSEGVQCRAADFKGWTSAHSPIGATVWGVKSGGPLSGATEIGARHPLFRPRRSQCRPYSTGACSLAQSILTLCILSLVRGAHSLAPTY